MEGWIKIHRQIKDHWIWKSQNRFQWWIDILLSVNHADTKLLIKGTLIECKRGQSVRSLETWAKDWNVTKKTVKDFFELLQKDSMLVYESIKISTRITVCNYDNYQDIVNTTETKGKRKVNGEETETTPKQECKEGIKNEKNDKKKEDSENKFSVPQKNDFINDIIKEFKKVYEEANELPYAILNKGKERSAAGKLLKEFKNQHPDFSSDQSLQSLSNYFDKVVNINDTWLRTNMSLSMLMSKFNEINNILRNGKCTGNKGGSDKEFLAVLSKHTN